MFVKSRPVICAIPEYKWSDPAEHTSKHHRHLNEDKRHHQRSQSFAHSIEQLVQGEHQEDKKDLRGDVANDTKPIQELMSCDLVSGGGGVAPNNETWNAQTNGGGHRQ